ncbi:alpha-L-fucosidase [Chryseolinea lacunae]|uniref:alpha-L-fucosidase n=1 Tax=Chryseolinea lacunae TaxID=2801331 RepID=A0ABS1KU52_9BACT|nr:alpha-L-fucosidase [Chryseolinea lacunae]MBL0742990.1 alpha-L-fucosidase [Chryseolinea lacunae]
MSALILFVLAIGAQAQRQEPRALSQLQQEFVDLRFGMFIHFNIPTYLDQDWADPEASPAIFNPTKLSCDQWAKTAKAANMQYGCLTTKHHSGFAIWDTKTTNYSVMNSPVKKDIVREYVNAFRANGLKVMLYYSILDTHHNLRPHQITPNHITLVKEQLTELLTNYGDISALIIDGWDAPWSRISYDDIPFEEIYGLIKSLQPNCLVMDLNAAKYPAEALFYTDIKSYEQGAGQHIARETNRLPALSCLPINSSWFWKTRFPHEPVKDAAKLVDENIIPFNMTHCNFILNVAPNRDGLIDDNAVAALKEIGKRWKPATTTAKLPTTAHPIISSNIAKHQPTRSSWSDDMWIMDFANDDDFSTAWISNPTVKKPWWEVNLQGEKPFNTVTVMESDAHVKTYRIEYYSNGTWKLLLAAESKGKFNVHRFDRVWGERLRITIDEFNGAPALAEVGLYDERR